MKKDFSETLKELRISAGYSQKQVYDILGVRQSTFSAWETGRAEPSADMLLKLCQLYKVNDIFAAFGYDGYNDDGSLRLNMKEITLIENYRELDEFGKETVNYILGRELDRINQLRDVTAPAKEEVAPIRLINYYYRLASAGTGQILFDTPPTKRIEIPNIKEYQHVDYAIGVNGKSMEPTYKDGDTLLIEVTEEINTGEIGIFLVDGECFVKKLGEKELISLNPDYRNIPLNETARCMGRVIGKL